MNKVLENRYNNLVEAGLHNKVYWSNKLISACYEMTLVEKRILWLSLSKLDQRTDITNTPVEITFDEYKTIFECNEDKFSLYNRLRESMDLLRKREIVMEDKERGSYTSYTMVITRKLRREDSTIVLQFHPDLIPYICMLAKHFTRFSVSDIRKIKSTNAWRLYEILMEHKHKFKAPGTLGKLEGTIIIIHEDWARQLGYEETDILFKQSGNFRQRVLIPAMEHLLSEDVVRSLSIVDSLKSGRKVSGWKLAYKIYGIR